MTVINIPGCPHCGAGMHGRQIGHVVHDYVQFWSCPDCCGTWPRYPERHPFFKHAEELRAAYDAQQLASVDARGRVPRRGTAFGPVEGGDCQSLRADLPDGLPQGAGTEPTTVPAPTPKTQQQEQAS